MDGEGEEAAEFSWSLLILETLVQGVVTFWDDSGVRFARLALTKKGSEAAVAEACWSRSIYL